MFEYYSRYFKHHFSDYFLNFYIIQFIENVEISYISTIKKYIFVRSFNLF